MHASMLINSSTVTYNMYIATYVCMKIQDYNIQLDLHTVRAMATHI